MSIFQCMMADISEAAACLPQALLGGMLLGICACGVWILLKRYFPKFPSVGTGKWIVVVLFVVYFLVLLQTVFFSREPGSRWGTEMHFLGTWGTTMQDHAWVLENILLFVPFGLLLPLFLPGKWHFITVPAGLLCSVCIELIQHLTGRGFCQLDDIIMNTLGTLTGYLLWALAALLLRGLFRLFGNTVRRRMICSVAAVFWMSVIFLFSGQPADESTQTSLRVERMICSVAVPGYVLKTPEEQTALAQRIEFPVRKGAHMTEYAILAVLFLGIVSRRELTRRELVRAVFLAAVYAAADEFHQRFVPGRSGQLRDVLIDSAGGTIGVLAAYGLLHKRER